MEPKLITEIRLIERYSRHNEAEDLRFRNYFKHYLKLSTKDLDAIVLEETDRVWSQIDCLDCGHCCKKLEPSIDDEDIRRLAKLTKVSAAEFKRRFTHTTHGDLVLKGLPCPYLGEGNACSIYEDRPKACRDYPYLRKYNFRSRSLAMLSNLDFCPVVFNVWQRLKARFWKR